MRARLLLQAHDAAYSVVTVNRYDRVGSIYVRKVMSRGRGPYFQLVRSHREEGKVAGGLGALRNPPEASRWTPTTSTIGASSRCSRKRRSPASPSTLRGIRAPPCCSPRTSTPRSCRRCWVTPPSLRPWTPTHTCCPACRTRRRHWRAYFPESRPLRALR